MMSSFGGRCGRAVVLYSDIDGSAAAVRDWCGSVKMFCTVFTILVLVNGARARRNGLRSFLFS